MAGTKVTKLNLSLSLKEAELLRFLVLRMSDSEIEEQTGMKPSSIRNYRQKLSGALTLAIREKKAEVNQVVG